MRIIFSIAARLSPVTSKSPLRFSPRLHGESPALRRGNAGQREASDFPFSTLLTFPTQLWGGKKKSKSSSPRQGLHGTFNFSYVSAQQLPAVRLLPWRKSLLRKNHKYPRSRPQRSALVSNWPPESSIKKQRGNARVESLETCSFPFPQRPVVTLR